MADVIISIVARRVAAIIEDQIRYEVNLVRGAEKEIIDLSDKLKTIKNVLDDAEKRGVNEQSVKNWLRKLERTAYEMDDVLDEWNYALLNHNIKRRRRSQQKVCCSFNFNPSSSSCSSFNMKVVVRRHTAKKIQNVKAALDQILKEKDEFSFLPTDHHPPLPKPPPRVQSTSSIQLDKVHGVEIDKNKNDIVNKLIFFNNVITDHIHSSQIQILSIVGMGGIGKTTLAQLVYNDARVNDSFDLRIWICVSDPFDVSVIARGIVNSVGKETIPRDTDQLELILQKLRDCISGKKFLLVLDDVWTEEYKEWEPLKINLNYGVPTSKILVTTRNERVANMMMRDNVDVEIYRPQNLSDEDCWKLLCRISLSKEECGKFEDVGKKIAKKCKGLPLAAKVLGSLLQYKNSLGEWENILESEIWQMEEAEVELFPHLLLSYNELSPPLKRCFSYCAVYPKDSYILSERLIEEWVALGYLGISDAGLELKGRDYFNNLAMRSLFQDFTKSYSGEQIAWCKMHDIVHSFAQFVRKSNDRVGAAEMSKRRSCQASCDHMLVSQVQEYRSLFWDKETPPNLCDCLTSLRVLRFQRILNATPKGIGNLIHLRWLELSGTTLCNEDLNIICSLYFLQTLLLASCSLREIPGEIGNLVELRHLNLHSNKELKELPESICNLVELQILNIERCRNMNQLPEGIHNLLNLQHLLIEETTVSGHFPRGLASLSGLRTLGSFHGGSGWSKMGLLKNLNRITGSLKMEIHVSGMEDLQELIEEAREAGLRNKIHIQTLDIQFKYEKAWWSLPSVGMEVIEALEPNDKLKILRIEGYKGSKLPHWISSPLNLVKEINLIGLSEVSSLPPLGKLPHLEALKMQGQYKLKLVGKDFLGILECSSTSTSNNDDVVVYDVAFPKLKKLVFDECPEWSEWEDVEEHTAVAIMPCLKELDVKLCGSLKKLPHCLLRNAFSLEILNIKYSFELIRSYGDEDGPNWRAISQNNPKLQLLIF